MTRHEVQILRAVGVAQRAVATKTETSVRSVRRIEREARVTGGDTAALIPARKVGRPSTAAPWAPQVETWLRDDPALPSLEILRRLLPGGKGVR